MPTFSLTLGGTSHDVTVSSAGVTVDGESYVVELDRRESSTSVRVDGRPFAIEILEQTGAVLKVRIGDREHQMELTGTSDAAVSVSRPSPGAAEAASGSVLAPMTGRVLRVAVKPGDVVATADLLVVLEAMKMENEIRAPRFGTVVRIAVPEGERVSKGATLVDLA